MQRYIEPFILKDLRKKMVFVGGPRQVGKTILSKSICHHYKTSRYLNLDLDSDRRIILKHQWPQDDQLVVFDELHKYPRWKRWIKGVYDTKSEHQQYLVTGSARLDVYRRGGDSLMGRYHYWRLHPFSLQEIPGSFTSQEAFKRLMTVGRFSESFLAEDLVVSFTAVKKWVEILEKMYVIFRVFPYTKNLPRAIQKPPKIYFFD